MLHKKTIFFAVLFTLVGGIGALPAQAAVVASIKPLGFIASAIADGVTDTEVLLPDGASEHDYSLRPSDVKRLQSADLVVWVGPEMEAFMQRSVRQVAPQKQLELSALNSIKPLLMKSSETANVQDEHKHHADDEGDEHHHHGEYNLHIWLSPDVARLSAVAIHDKLVELMPEHRAKLDANLHDFISRLNDTDKKVGAVLAPAKGKGYFVFHDAYGYFEKHYGLTPLGHFTVNPEIQPGAQRLHDIRTQLVEQKAVCVFAEPQFRPAVIHAVAQGTSVRSGSLDPLGIGVALGKDSYMQFLTQLSNQYASCLNGK